MLLDTGASGRDSRVSRRNHKLNNLLLLCTFSQCIIQFKEHYLQLYGANGPSSETSKKRNKRLAQLMEEYTSGEDDDAFDVPVTFSPAPSPSKPWLRKFNQYLDGANDVPGGMPLAQWWGVHYILIFFFALYLI